MTTPTFAKTHNLIAYLAKPAESEGFKQIIDFLNGSSVRYALTTSPTIRTSCIKKFWLTAKVKTVNDEVRVQALIDAKRVNIKESSIRRTLKLDDEEGISCLANDDIFTCLANMGHEKISDKLTFYKAFFLPQWKFLIYTILQCLSAKTTSWNEFRSTMASAIIRLATNQKFNFSRYILLSLVKNIEDGVPFYMFPRVGTGFSRVITPLFENMLVPAELLDLCTRLSKKVLDLESKVLDIKSSFTEKIVKLEDRVHKLEEENRILKEKSFNYAKIDTAAPVEEKEKSFKQGRMIADMDEDVEVNLEEAQAKAYNLDLQHSEKVLNMQDIDEEKLAKVEEVLEVVTATKLFTEVVTTTEPTTTTAAQLPKASAPRRRRGVVIQDLEETATSVIMHTKLEAELNANINWNVVIGHVKRSERQNNALISEIRHLFEKNYNSNQAFLERVEEEVTVQEKEIKEEGNKRQGKSLQILSNDDDDVYTEATPLASKIHVVNYQIHHENNKPYYKIIRADGTHKLFLSFITLLKNFNREDLETLWKLVKERFETTKPKNFSDDFLLKILKIMFEKPNIEVNVWKDQKGRYGLAKKKYPLTHFTLKQMLNNVRLEVEEESDMSLELLSAAAWNYYC
nr:hypothetical protein [Tanacetum cinerariifolium]